MSTRLPPAEARPAPGAPEPAAPGAAPLPPRLPTARHRPRRRWWPWLVAALVVLLVAGGAVRLLSAPAAPPPAAPAAPAVKLTARGRVQPVQQARIGTLTGGVVVRLAAVVGEPVADQQELARVRGPNGTVEVLTAPWAGTVTAVPVHYGDTVMAGTVLVTIGDLSRLQVETTDVDEFLIARLARGQPVRMTVDALDGRELAGVVERITLQPQPTGAGDEHYPVVIGLTGRVDELRPGMTVRLQIDGP
jgi:multidrug efflux pump subunit AcrA (membrane-fusion protein)